MVPFVSPNTLKVLQLKDGFLSSSQEEKFPIINGIPRFVLSESYADSFGLEWQIHAKTQLDSQTGIPVSRIRMERCLGRPLESLKNLSVLEAGCGAGRFTEHLINSQAYVHCIDLSNAVIANKKNIGDRPNYLVAQADLLNPPFTPESFDIVFCLGVLQHLPSPEEGIKSLWRMVKPGGLLVFDHYAWSLSLVTKLSPLYRLYLKNLAPAEAKKATDQLVKIFFPWHWAFRHYRPLQMLLSRISPVLFYGQTIPQYTKEQHYDLCQLDTFDHLTDKYKHIRTVRQIKNTIKQLEAKEIWVERGGNGIEARCRK